jgi:hypothetical protein
VIRASGDGQVISAHTIPAPPIARAPRCTRWKSPGTPSFAEYCAIGDTTIRFLSTTPRARNGVNIGGIGRDVDGTGTPACAKACAATQFS